MPNSSRLAISIVELLLCGSDPLVGGRLYVHQILIGPLGFQASHVDGLSFLLTDRRQFGQCLLNIGNQGRELAATRLGWGRWSQRHFEQPSLDSLG
ncbi:hypothetical protein [Fodinicola feengrottensis]|uniref:hypothetical protein n=1 Tax=Fodinicola feengrottensis TaxID=435914 RepID=UPI0013D26612